MGFHTMTSCFGPEHSRYPACEQRSCSPVGVCGQLRLPRTRAEYMRRPAVSWFFETDTVIPAAGLSLNQLLPRKIVRIIQTRLTVHAPRWEG